MRTIQHSLKALEELYGFSLAPPVREEDITEIEDLRHLKFPDDLREFYLQSDGLTNEAHHLQFVSLESLGQAYSFEDWPFLSDLNLLVFGDANDSNPWCVISSGPLRGMVAQISHDGDSGLRFASVREMLHCLNELEDIHDLSAFGTLPPISTNAAFASRYSQLLESRAALSADHEAVSWLLQFAMDLCASTEVNQIGSLMNMGDEYVRDKALQRLRLVGTEEARVLLEADGLAFQEFQRQLERMASPEKIRRLNLPALFTNRREPDFESRLRTLLEQ